MKSESYFRRGKRPGESQSETAFIMLPSDASPRGNVFGGTILKHVDLVLLSGLVTLQSFTIV